MLDTLLRLPGLACAGSDHRRTEEQAPQAALRRTLANCSRAHECRTLIRAGRPESMGADKVFGFVGRRCCFIASFSEPTMLRGPMIAGMELRKAASAGVVGLRSRIRAWQAQ